MDNSPEAQLKRHHRKLVNASMSKTKTCYFIACDQPTIRAHAISNARLLLKLSDGGHVMYFDRDSRTAGSLIETGRGAATTFNGFCGEHDKIFLPIDDGDYVVGDETQEYLFAMRAAAKEFTTRVGLSDATRVRLENSDPQFPLSDYGRAVMETFKSSFNVGTNDQRVTRGIFNDTFRKGKLNVIGTAVIGIDEELPVAVSSTFNMELDISGKLINDVSNEALDTRMKPCFLTIFPQNGKTYCLISYLRKDREAYKFLHDLNALDEQQKQVIVSNLLTSYTENFVVNPSHWSNLSKETLAKYSTIFANFFKTEHIPFIADRNYNLFPSAQTS